MPDLSGQTLGAYRIISQIGKGGMATVYKAFQPSLERFVAVKVLPAYYAEQDESFLKRFRLEARAVARLRHPNILTIYEYGEENGITFIVMEYVEAGTLTERLALGPMLLAEIEPILRQVAAALSYAHDQGVIHRDVKPSNILLPRPEWPLLTDFGLAKIVGGSHLTQTGSIAGTPSYMSPEQGRGESVDHLSDVYSLGIVLYEMATGRVPFTAETPMAVVVKHMIEPLPLPRTLNPDLPESVEAVILKALAKQPAVRYPRADGMAAAFSQALTAAPAVVTAPAPRALSQTLAPESPASGAVAPAPSRSRRLLPLALAGVGACVCLSLAALAVARNRGAQDPQPTDVAATELVIEVPEGETRTFDQLMADGQARLEQGDVEGAAADFQAAIGYDPGNLDVYWDVSNRFRDSGYPDVARAFADAAVSAGSDEAWFHDSAGWQYYDLGAFAEAVAQFQRAVELDPSGALWSYIGLSDSLRIQGDFDSARVALDALSELQPFEEPDLYEGLGWGYSEVGAYPEGQAAFRQAVTLDPANVDAWSGLIDATYSVDGLQAAYDTASEATAANPSDAQILVRLGDLAWELGDPEGAEGAYRPAMELDPTFIPAYLALANLLEDQGRPEVAAAALELGIERNPQDPWLHEALGQNLIERGEAEAAFQHFNAAFDIDPSYGWFGVQAASAGYQHNGDVDSTAELLERSAAAMPEDADLLDAVGQVYEAMGDCGLASAYYRRALDINPQLENPQAGLTRCGG